ncbi:hypothetical protein E2C01_088864 [Portunus trituberculatus]|uniref:Uncharacterized protein n=1 Tax=Portunus trituberculatus TaxID=210409 RepID=A0A5B7JN14_PORTR|nr:hypothetical protein [Portunus trituberculatus]
MEIQKQAGSSRVYQRKVSLFSNVLISFYTICSSSLPEYELCVRRVLSLALPGEPEGVTEAERELFVRSQVNTQHRAMTRALGALLRWVSDACILLI